MFKTTSEVVTKLTFTFFYLSGHGALTCRRSSQQLHDDAFCYFSGHGAIYGDHKRTEYTEIT